MVSTVMVCLVVLAAPAKASPARPAAGKVEVKPLGQAEMVKLLSDIDESMYSPGEDYKALVYMEQKQKGQPDRVFELFVFRRDKDDALVMLFTKPKTDAGMGYLRIGKNMWNYSPSTGKWERHTIRDRVAGTDALTGDFDAWTLSQTFDPAYDGVERLGSFTAHRLKLTGKPDLEVAFPTNMMWIDTKAAVPLKIEARAESGRAVRTTYYPQWLSQPGSAQKKDVYYPKEIRIYNEIDKGSQTVIKVQRAELGNLPPNLFTKAWLESQTR